VVETVADLPAGRVGRGSAGGGGWGGVQAVGGVSVRPTVHDHEPRVLSVVTGGVGDAGGVVGPDGSASSCRRRQRDWDIPQEALTGVSVRPTIHDHEPRILNVGTDGVGDAGGLVGPDGSASSCWRRRQDWDIPQEARTGVSVRPTIHGHEPRVLSVATGGVGDAGGAVGPDGGASSYRRRRREWGIPQEARTGAPRGGGGGRVPRGARRHEGSVDSARGRWRVGRGSLVGARNSGETEVTDLLARHVEVDDASL
jgi:hypothetical protein